MPPPLCSTRSLEPLPRPPRPPSSPLWEYPLWHGMLSTERVAPRFPACLSRVSAGVCTYAEATYRPCFRFLPVKSTFHEVPPKPAPLIVGLPEGTAPAVVNSMAPPLASVPPRPRPGDGLVVFAACSARAVCPTLSTGLSPCSGKQSNNATASLWLLALQPRLGRRLRRLISPPYPPPAT